MKITTRSRYGTRLMVELALRWGGPPVQLGGIAKQGDLPVKYLEQLIIPLKRGGLIKSTRGPSGGYSLAYPPERITIWDIVKELEGTEGVAPCVADPMSCTKSRECPTRDVWTKVARAIEEQLTSIALSDLL
ncbi:RrF2 family transcriptional regulator [Desulfoplanes formicivorans]|uniref:Rrf2 family transcriptional regulator n=1 Tax=Desulfoplanes formicivorans TaxID=1592317 RepID=A0A194AMB0_9BACT|nr:Rrf2 family transcriptional regulator [Desulfoplanes formicivorans]GAU09779.1 hypothetical protein DPF_2512 [Desulfoplanes formicivorans]